MGKRCFWCNADPDEAAARHEGPHATWCVHFRESQRGGRDFDLRPGAINYVTPGEELTVRFARAADLRRQVMDAERTALELIADIAEGSTTANSLPHIAKIARRALATE